MPFAPRSRNHSEHHAGAGALIRSFARPAVVLAVFAGAMFAAGCGGGLGASTASRAAESLDEIRELAAQGRCTAASARAEELSDRMRKVGDSAGESLRRDLVDGADHLRRLIEQTCGVPRKEPIDDGDGEHSDRGVPKAKEIEIKRPDKPEHGRDDEQRGRPLEKGSPPGLADPGDDAPPASGGVAPDPDDPGGAVGDE